MVNAPKRWARFYPAVLANTRRFASPSHRNGINHRCVFPFDHVAALVRFPFWRQSWPFRILAFLLLVVICTGCLSPEPWTREERVASEPVRIGRRDAHRPFSLLTRTPSDEGAIIIEEDGVTLDLQGGSIAGKHIYARTDPDLLVGRGIVVRNAKNVTIRNARVYGFKVGIYAENAPGLVIENCNVSDNYRQRLKSTPFREHYGDWIFPHDNDQNEWLRYGAGIYVLRCDGARLINNRARRGQNGICLVSTRDAHVEANDMSFLSGWGVALWRSGRNMIVGNRFDYCVRGFSEGRYERGQDSAGILLFEQSSENIITGNSATHGGDGLFIYAGHETLKETGEGGCNRNLVFENDFSYAVMHGIESTFCDQNAFVHNMLLGCTNGLWCGYSTRTTIAQNVIRSCQNGVAIEHGRNNLIEENLIAFTGTGVWVWWDRDPGLFALEYCKRNGTASEDEKIRRNQIRDCDVGVHTTDSVRAEISGNRLTECHSPLMAEGEERPPQFDANEVISGSIRNQTPHAMNGSDNQLSTNVELSGPIEFTRSVGDPLPAQMIFDCSSATYADTRKYLAKRATADQMEKIAQWKSTVRYTDAPVLMPRRGFSVPQGRDRIIIGEWGPCDYEERDDDALPRLFAQGGKAFIQIPTYNQSFAFRVMSGAVELEPRSGVTPALIEIRSKDPSSGAEPYSVRLLWGIAGVWDFSGVLVPMSWHTRFYEWPVELDPRTGEEHWATIIAKPSIHEVDTEQINFVWGAGGPMPDGPRDRFAAVAESRLTLPPGRWRVRMMSDDGVRVYVDDKRIIDNWTWHVPQEDVGEFETTTSGEHQFRIEYFELDGHAELRFTLESIPPEPPSPTSAPSESTVP